MSNIEIEEESKLKYRYILIALLEVIIILLVIFIFIVNLKDNKKSTTVSEEKNAIEENDIMVVTIDEQKKQQELEMQKEREREKQEEENATGIIYLTFDDGPSSDSTPQILDILEKKNIKATFFVIHYSEENAKLVKREYEQGHTVALHGYTHAYSEVYKSADACIDNFLKIQEQVKQTIGVESKIIRFPGGSSNTVSRKYTPGVMTELTQRLVESGFKYYDWNADSDDAGKAKTSEDVYRNVTSEIKAKRNNVVLMHDFAKNGKTINALEDIINFGLENGYVFRKISDDTPMVTHSVNN